jgi:hypothetical protein
MRPNEPQTVTGIGIGKGMELIKNPHKPPDVSQGEELGSNYLTYIRTHRFLKQLAIFLRDGLRPSGVPDYRQSIRITAYLNDNIVERRLGSAKAS